LSYQYHKTNIGDIFPASEVDNMPCYVFGCLNVIPHLQLFCFNVLGIHKLQSITHVIMAGSARGTRLPSIFGGACAVSGLLSASNTPLLGVSCHHQAPQRQHGRIWWLGMVCFNMLVFVVWTHYIVFRATHTDIWIIAYSLISWYGVCMFC
jgi:MFS-type transporter involved in bile tolerance (Atg22 family)